MNKHKYPKFVSRLGIELEGLFHPDKARVKIPDGKWKGDGSLRTSPEFPNLITRELVSVPLPNWDEFNKWVWTHFNDATNESCGTHIHMSVNNGLYMTLMAEENGALLEHTKRKFEAFLDNPPVSMLPKTLTRLKSRMEGGSEYALWDSSGVGQLTSGGNRYTVYNFCAYRKFRTMEFRLLPGFEKPQELTTCVLYWLNEVLVPFFKEFKAPEKVITQADLVVNEENLKKMTKKVKKSKTVILQDHKVLSPGAFRFAEANFLRGYKGKGPSARFRTPGYPRHKPTKLLAVPGDYEEDQHLEEEF